MTKSDIMPLHSFCWFQYFADHSLNSQESPRASGYSNVCSVIMLHESKIHPTSSNLLVFQITRAHLCEVIFLMLRERTLLDGGVCRPRLWNREVLFLVWCEVRHLGGYSDHVILHTKLKHMKRSSNFPLLIHLSENSLIKLCKHSLVLFLGGIISSHLKCLLCRGLYIHYFLYTTLTVSWETQILFCFRMNCPLVSTDCNRSQKWLA